MQKNSQFTLFSQRRFAPFFWTQFLGALNDNVFKTALLTILTYDALSWTDMDPGLLNNLIPGLFILPFFLFSATSGQLSDKLEKGRVARFVKLLEIAIMCVAAYGWMTHHLWLLIAAVIGMGVHSTLRAGEIRLPAAAVEARGTGRGQWPDRNGHLRRHSAW